MKYLFLILLIPPPLFACQNQIPESEARKAIALEPNAGSKSCKDLPEEKCVCFDGIDFREADLIDGELIPNPDKKFARENSEKKRMEEAKAKEEKCKAFSFKGTTIAQLRQEMNDERECRKP